MGDKIKIEEEMKKLRDDMIKEYINSELIFGYVKELEEKNKELEEKNTELKEQFKKAIEYRQALEEDLFENNSNYVVSKNKIREKLEKIQILINEYEENEKSSKYKVDKSYWHENKMKYVYKRNILEELLEV